ncbi:hypothetical protein P4S72_29000 [Vibrio sp. PP-XX7]
MQLGCVFRRGITTHIDHYQAWGGDGVIADFDNPAIQQLLTDSALPLVGVGGSYEDEKAYPNVPYVATDNRALVELALQHLKAKGLEHFAFYGVPPHPRKRWATEREKAFLSLVKQGGYSGAVYRGNNTNPHTWQYDMNRLADWVQRLPLPWGLLR